MTIGKQPTTGTHVPILHGVGDHIQTRPMRYPVMVRSIKDQQLGEILMGHIVTHMAIEDYCKMHDLYLQELFPGTRGALSYERTELF